MSNLSSLLEKNRSYRRFHQHISISNNQLHNWIKLTRFAASGRNKQPLKYIVSNSLYSNEIIFPTLSWAGYIKDWDGPLKGERPAAYIIQLLDKSISEKYYCDDGIAAQNILLGAVDEGFGGCILRAINRPVVMRAFNINSQYEIINIIALGKPDEKIVIEQVVNNNTEYWRDKNGIHHVPKRNIEDIIINTL